MLECHSKLLRQDCIMDRTTLKEKNDEALKSNSKRWWSEHSQDYVPEGKSSHIGAKQELNDGDFLNYLNEIDKNFYEQAYFAQKRGAPLFSELIPIDFIKNKKVLEIGCGLGSHAEALSKAGAILTTIDISQTSVDMTLRRLALKGLSADIIVADAEQLPFDDASFDYIWSWGVIHHSPNTIACANEIARVLKPGGRLGIMLYHDHSLYNWINVIFRYGILRGKLLKMSIAELHNRYTDGKYIGGAPLAKYYSKKQIKRTLFPELKITRQIAFEQKKAVSFWVPEKYRRKFEKLIPDRLYSWLFKHLGFLLLTEAEKKH